jgi:hypothetical protein
MGGNHADRNHGPRPGEMKMKFLTLSDGAHGILTYIYEPNRTAIEEKQLNDAVCDGQWLAMVGASQAEAEELYNTLIGEGFAFFVPVESGVAAFVGADDLAVWQNQI